MLFFIQFIRKSKCITIIITDKKQTHLSQRIFTVEVIL